MQLLFFLVKTFVLAGALTPSTRSSLIREQALAYLSFDVSLDNHTGQILSSGNSTRLLVRKGTFVPLYSHSIAADSGAYLWLHRNNLDPDLNVYQVRSDSGEIDNRKLTTTRERSSCCLGTR